MNDPYKKFFDELSKTLAKLIKMIVFVAERTLSAKEFIEFTEEFKEKPDHKNMSDLFRKEWEVDE